MTQKPTILSQEGLEKLEDELELLKTVKRREMAGKIKVAMSFGDLSENAEYDEAKNEQAMVEGRILEIEAILQNAAVLDTDSLDTERIQIGNKVKLKALKDEKELVFTIVSSKEVNVREKRISDESPVGKAVMGHQKGEVVDAEAPSGLASYEILEISK
ncbi:MAG: transcription elongation factor GreA [Oscillospiraceae bacterium]|jgi:transcription elongation factor GreA|nr:transcription elongation factor GreA [Oscillospiraceae bacterium]